MGDPYPLTRADAIAPADWADIMAYSVVAWAGETSPERAEERLWDLITYGERAVNGGTLDAIAAALREAYEAGCRDGYDIGARDGFEDRSYQEGLLRDG